MSLLGFDAIGRLALGQLPGGHTTTSLGAAAGAFAMTGTAATFSIVEAPAAGSFALSGVAASFTVKEAPSAGAFAFTGVAASFRISEAPTAGAFTMNGKPANEIVLEADQPGVFVAAGVDTPLHRTGDDIDHTIIYGGIGHYKFELEEAKQLAAITRRGPPGFVDLRSKPQFPSFGGPPIAPAAPVVDLHAIANQRMQAEMQAAQAAAKRRREAEAILLLAC